MMILLVYINNIINYWEAEHIPSTAEKQSTSRYFATLSGHLRGVIISHQALQHVAGEGKCRTVLFCFYAITVCTVMDVIFNTNGWLKEIPDHCCHVLHCYYYFN